VRCRVRTLTRLRNGGISQSEQLIETEGPRLVLGRGTDSDLFLKDLRVNYHHAEIVKRDFDLVIEAVDGSSLRIDEVPVERAALAPGSEVEVGPYRLQVLPDEPGADLTLTLELVVPPPSSDTTSLADPRRTRLEGTWLQKRPLSWALFAALIVIGLALPILAHRTPTPEAPATERSPGLLAGINQLWLVGELAASHRLLTDNCEACHEVPFVPVRSQACASCHQTIQHHFETERFQFARFEPTNCMGCHMEHRGPKGVIPTWQSLCADCHRDLSTQQETALLDVADFGSAHPEFRPSVIVNPESGRIERVAIGEPDFPPENSNLRFPHDIHLAEVCEAPAGGATDQASLAMRQACTVIQMAQQRMQKEALECVDCHVPEPGGVNMLPVRMQDHCAMCHRLEFDPAAPGRVLPHGQPDEVIAVIRDFYVARAVRGAPLVEPAQTGVRLRPGETAAAEPAPQAPAPDPVRRGEEFATQKLDTVFGRSLCGVCHEITTPEQSARGEWEVRPVKVAALWMPKARFDHGAHKTTPCLTCHEATTSATSEDVLMPAIEDCRACHGGEHARTAIPSTCIMCHVYHLEGQQPMLPGHTPAVTLAQ
jgi:hypothetical protein